MAQKVLRNVAKEKSCKTEVGCPQKTEINLREYKAMQDFSQQLAAR